MLFSFASLTALVIAAKASPVPSASSSSGLTDIIIFQYALTLEHLENTFYTQALAKFDEAAFAAEGFAPIVRGRFEQIGQHEQSHVNTLVAALGKDSLEPCTYNFPYTDVKSFTALSQLLEGVGTSAYLGAAQFIQSKQFLTAAASILTTEARHASWVAASVNQDTPWSGPMDIPLDPNEVFSLASKFIVTCPSTNPSLPFTAFPMLSTSPATAQPGDKITLAYDASKVSSTASLFLVLFVGLEQTFIAITDNTVILPTGLTGTVYAIVTTSGTEATDDVTVAGPTVFQFPDPTPSS